MRAFRTATSQTAKGSRSVEQELKKAKLTYRFTLPNRRFHRHQGEYADHFFSPEGDLMDEMEWRAREDEWLATSDDRAYVGLFDGMRDRTGSLRQLDRPAEARYQQSSDRSRLRQVQRSRSKVENRTPYSSGMGSSPRAHRNPTSLRAVVGLPLSRFRLDRFCRLMTRLLPLAW